MIAGVPATGPLDGHYTFRRVFPEQQTRAFRQTFDLAIEGGRATLRIVTVEDDLPRTNADLAQATFGRPFRTVEGAGTATLDAGGELVLELTGGTRWTCRRLEVEVSPAGAKLTRSGDSCTEDSPVEPATTTRVRALSCRALGSAPDGPPSLRGDVSRERRRDSDRWTFLPAPGLELLGDDCVARTGILRVPSK